jgi:hypothetical protein
MLHLLIHFLILPFLSQAVPSSYHRPSWVKKSKDGVTEDSDGWVYLVFAAVLVLLGGAFSGLTIA